MEINISNFITRADLENYINATIGRNAEENKKAGHIIKGTEKQLKQLQLSDTCVVFGIPVISTYGSTDKFLKEKISPKQWK